MMTDTILTTPGIVEYVCTIVPVGDAANVHINAPTEPIVRCRDCARAECQEVHLLNGMKRRILTCARFQNFQHETQPEGFCAWGERMDE